MNTEEPGKEQVIDEDFHGEFDENLFQDLVADDILDPNFNIDNVEGGRQGTGQQGPQRMVVVDLMRKLPKFSGEKLNQQTIILMHLMIIWKYNKVMLLMPMWHKSYPDLVILYLIMPKVVQPG